MNFIKAFQLVLLLNLPALFTVGILSIYVPIPTSPEFLEIERLKGDSTGAGQQEITTETDNNKGLPNTEYISRENNISTSRQIGIGDLIALIAAINNIITVIGQFFGAIGNIPALLLLLPLLLIGLLIGALGLFFILRDLFMKFFKKKKEKPLLKPAICSCHKHNYHGWKANKGWKNDDYDEKKEFLGWIRENNEEDDYDDEKRRISKKYHSYKKRPQQYRSNILPSSSSEGFEQQFQITIGKFVLSTLGLS